MQIQYGRDNTILFFGINKLEVFGGNILYTEIKINKNFNQSTNFKSLEPEVLTFCFVTGCVSARRDKCYLKNHQPRCYSTVEARKLLADVGEEGGINREAIE